MGAKGWHILRDEHAVTLARQLPAQFDVAVATRMDAPRPVSLTVLAHQVRQDVWRALQKVRGFSPVVRVGQTDASIRLEVGGRLDGRAGGAEDAIAAVLENPANRRRWLAHAGRRA